MILNFIRNKPIQFIILYGIVLRILLFSFYQHVSIFPDSEGYTDLAKRLSDFNLVGYDGMRSPGFPMLIALCNGSLWLTIAIQFVVGIVTSVVVYKNLLLLQFNKKSAVITTVLLGSLLHVFFYETAILTESITLFFVNLVFYFVLDDWLEKGSLKKIFISSFVLGILIIIKPFYVFFPFLMYGFYILKDFNFRKIISRKLVLFVFPLLSYLGWSYINKMNTGYFVPSTLNGYYISQNCVYFAEKSSPEFEPISSIYVKYRTKAIAENDNISMTIWRAYDELIATTGLSFADLSNELSKFSKDAISKNPGAYLYQVVFYSWVDFWRPNICWNETEFKIGAAANSFFLLWKLQAFMVKVFKIAFVFLLPLTLFRFIKTRKVTHEFILTVFILSTSILQALATFGTNSRFSYPFEFMIIALVLLQLKQFYFLRISKK